MVASFVSLLPVLLLWLREVLFSAGYGSPSRPSCATAAGFPRVISRLRVSSSLRPLRASLMPNRLTGPMTLLGVRYARSPEEVGPSGRGPELCRVGPVRMVFLPPLPRRSHTLPPLKPRRCVLSNLLPADTAAPALSLPLVLQGTLPMSVILSRCGGCLPALNVARLVALTVCVMIIVPSPLLQRRRCPTLS